MKRKLITGFGLLLLIFSLAISVVPQPAFAAENNNYENDKKRQILIAANECFDRTDVIDTDDKIKGNTLDEAYGDLLREGDYGQTEKIVVGFQLDGGNGVDSCLNLMPRALGIAGARSSYGGPAASDEESGKQVMMQQYVLHGSQFITGQDYDAKNSGNNESKYLGSLISKAIAKYPPPSESLKVDRVVPLVGYCFTLTTDANPTNYNDGRGDFKVAGIGTFQQRDNIDWKGEFGEPGGWIKENDGTFSTSPPAIGDLNLDFGSGTSSFSVNDFKQNNSNNSSDFYPLGPGMSETAGYKYSQKHGSDGQYGGAFVDCHFVKNNASWIFKDKKLWTAGENGQVNFKGAATAKEGKNNQDANGAPSHAVCEAKGFSLSWFVCPIVNGIAEAFDLIFEKVVIPLLQVDSINVGTTYKQDGEVRPNPIYVTWSAFRLYANIMLIIALLVLVFGQAIGGGLIDAYTAKKIVPRLVIAAIAINLSIYIAALAVDVTNIIGHGIYDIMVAPLGENLAFNLNVGANVAMLGSFAAAGFAVALAPGAAIPFLLLFIVVPAIIAAIGVVVTLVLRQAIILLLVIISPVAFALYCLPNTEQYFKKWWDNFFRTLLVFPIVMALVGAVNVMAAVMGMQADQERGPSAFLLQLVSIVAILLPLFIIPFAFKMAGGITASIYGGISKASAGLKSMSRRAGVAQGKKGFETVLKKGGYKDYKVDSKGRGVTANDRLKMRLNKYGQRAAIIGSGKAGLNPTKMRENLQNHPLMQTRNSVNSLLKGEDEEFELYSGDDTWSAGVAASNTEEEMDSFLKRFEQFQDDGERAKAVKAYSNLRKRHGTDALKQVGYLKGLAGGTVYDKEHKDAKTGETFTLSSQAALARAAGQSDSNRAFLASTGKRMAMEGGRADQAANFGTLFRINQALERGIEYQSQIDELNAVGVFEDINGNALQKGSRIHAKDADLVVAAKAYEVNGPGTILNPGMKDDTVKNVVSKVVDPKINKDRLDAQAAEAALVATDPNDAEAVEKAQKKSRDATDAYVDSMADLSALYDEAGRTAPGKAKILREEVMSKEVSFHDMPTEIKTHLERIAVQRSDPDKLIKKYKMDAAGEFELDANGQQILESVEPDPQVKLNYAEIIEGLHASHPRWRVNRREYGSVEGNIMGQRAQGEQEAGNQPKPPGTT